MTRVARFFGACLIVLFGMALMSAVGVLIVGAYCATYPLHRVSPRNRKLRALIDVALALAAVGVAFGGGPPGEGEDDEAARKLTQILTGALE